MELSSMKKILLFSPTGQVGSRLKCKLADLDYEARYLSRDDCTVRENEEIDVCIYTAGVTSARQETTEKYVIDNCYDATKIIKLCKEHNVKKIIYLSSDEIYGQLTTESLNVNSDRINMNVYAMTKYLAEQIVVESGMQYCILRLPGIVNGLCAGGNTFLERIVRDIQNGKEVICYNLDKQFNNVVHVDDLCDFIIKLIEHDCENKVLHLGQPDNVTLREILCYLKKEFNSESEVKEGNSLNKRYFTLPIHDAEQEGYTGRGIFVILDELINCLKQREP
jgi:nucleoside-diphosphate-sugar epimerase